MSEQRPADLAAVAADDALLDMLGSAGRTPADTDGALARVLAAWRREVHAGSNRDLVDTDQAAAAIQATHPRARRRPDVAIAAGAVLAIAFSAIGLASRSATPGDLLYPVRAGLYGEYVPPATGPAQRPPTPPGRSDEH